MAARRRPVWAADGLFTAITRQEPVQAKLAVRDPDLWASLSGIASQLKLINDYILSDYQNYDPNLYREEYATAADFESIGHYDSSWSEQTWPHLEEWQRNGDDRILDILTDEKADYYWREAFDGLAKSHQGDFSSSNPLSKYVRLGYNLAASLYSVYEDLDELPLVRNRLEAKLSLLVIAMRNAQTATEGERNDLNQEFGYIITRKKELAWHKRQLKSKTREQTLESIDGTAYSITLLLTFFMLSASFVFLGVAWSRSDGEEMGSVADVDFWTLLQNSAMQFLGLTTAVVPIALRRPETVLRWPLAATWILVASGLVGCLAAPILYTVAASTIWSAVASFLGSVAQTFLVPQLALEISSSWRKVKAN